MDNEQKTLLLNNLIRAMAFDRMMLRAIYSGSMVGFYHEGGIALAPGVAAASFLREDDFLAPHYRAHGLAHMIAKGIDVTSYVAEHMGREAGCCAGRSSSHYFYPESRVYGSSANIGANLVTSLGYGYAALYKSTDQVVMACAGDGAYGEGRAHEALLMAANWKLPMVFWCENNGMSQYSPIEDIFPKANCSDLAAGYGIPAKVVDGQDLIACGEAALEAIAHARRGDGPIFIECMTLRAQEHAVGGLNNAGSKARDPELMAKWKAERDPLERAKAALIDEGVIDSARFDSMNEAAGAEAERALESAKASDKAMPAVDELMATVYADA
ncbi:MAG: thiamine pyrophosphate-dependent dehydrogenase E1 component subunit alpha [Pseudomonadota bacterium]